MAKQPAQPYNGHKSYEYWNVALWLANDYGLYTMAKEAKNQFKDDRAAARFIFKALLECGSRKTPDGVAFNIARIQAAIKAL